MIIKASQRGNAKELARHLMNTQDNEHIETHEIRGFIDDSVQGAFEEAQAVSQGTRCSQFLFSVSLNPPKTEQASIAEFEDAIDQIENKMKLTNHPRVVVFHEKNGRRHAHAVWSRINSESMTAVNLPFYKNKMKDIAKELYLKHGWELPQGFIDKELRNPLNFTQDQWQQSKRLNETPQAIKTALKECWAISDNKSSFTQALEQQGFYLAKGDRRGYVAVDWRGEVFSLSRWMDVKSKALQARIGNKEDLTSVDETRDKIDQAMVQRIQSFVLNIRKHYDHRLSPLQRRKVQMTERHKAERKRLADVLKNRQQEDQKQRHAGLKRGFHGLWDRMTGKHAEIIKQNEREIYQSFCRGRDEKDQLIYHQLDERQSLQKSFDNIRAEQENDIAKAKELLFSKNMPQAKVQRFEKVFNVQSQAHSVGIDMEM